MLNVGDHVAYVYHHRRDDVWRYHRGEVIYHTTDDFYRVRWQEPNPDPEYFNSHRVFTEQQLRVTSKAEDRICVLSSEEQQELKTLMKIFAHRRSDEQMQRFGELNGKASYWDFVAISPPSGSTRDVVSFCIKQVGDEWRAYAASAHYGHDEHTGYDESGQCDSDSYYYLIPEYLHALAQQVVNSEADSYWLTVEAGALGEPTGPLLKIGNPTA